MARFEHVSGNTGCLYLRGNCIPVYCMSEKEWIIMIPAHGMTGRN